MVQVKVNSCIIYSSGSASPYRTPPLIHLSLTCHSSELDAEELNALSPRFEETEMLKRQVVQTKSSSVDAETQPNTGNLITYAVSSM